MAVGVETTLNIQEKRCQLIIFALAAPIGVNTKAVVDKLYRLCKDRNLNYTCQEIQLSQSITQLFDLDKTEAKTKPHDPETFDSDKAKENIIKINQGNYANAHIQELLDTQHAEHAYTAHALAAITEIEEALDAEPTQGQAFILRSLKRCDEVALLRHLFGDSFFMLGLSSCKEKRTQFLQRYKDMSEQDAQRLIDIDEREKEPWGQQMSEVFQHADAFINMDEKDWESQLERIFQLIFGHPYLTPSPDEFAMNIASQAALRSADLSRQVGAAIFSAQHEILAIGCNEVPHYGGGQYWCNEADDQRDFQRGCDPNKREIHRLTQDIIKNLNQQYASDTSKKDEYKKIAMLIETAITDNLDKITEYGRAVHAEMESLLSALRTGTPVQGATLYSTTFPCHNCAKHIVDAGIVKVVYIEPYPKSLTETLHDDSIVHTANTTGVQNKVIFSPFVGVAPRRFTDLFKMKISANHDLKRKEKSNHDTVEWQKRLRISCKLKRKQLKERLAELTQILPKKVKTPAKT